jgi:hypothetical protein
MDTSALHLTLKGIYHYKYTATGKEQHINRTVHSLSSLNPFLFFKWPDA